MFLDRGGQTEQFRRTFQRGFGLRRHGVNRIQLHFGGLRLTGTADTGTGAAGSRIFVTFVCKMMAKLLVVQ